MSGHVVLVVSADGEARGAWSTAIRAAGDWPLEASSLAQARHYLHKLRPARVLVDAQGGAACRRALLTELRAVPALRGIPLVIAGPPTSADGAWGAQDQPAPAKDVSAATAPRGRVSGEGRAAT